eukprot:5584697-Prymnesium_polylepis.1
MPRAEPRGRLPTHPGADLVAGWLLPLSRLQRGWLAALGGALAHALQMALLLSLGLTSGWRAPQPAMMAGFGGFGAPKAPPPTFEEVIASFPTRLPDDVGEPCPCGKNGEAYATCCRPYHLFEKKAETAE